MSHNRDCPEFRLARSDSKDPATTCGGLTADGRRCRRTVASKASSLSSSGNTVGGASRRSVQRAEVFCWQHQTQAANSQVVTKYPVTTLKGRSSLDTLVERTGLLTVEDEPRNKKATRKRTPQDAGRNSQRQIVSPVYRPSTAPVGHAVPTVLGSPVSAKKKSSSAKKLVCFITNVSDDDGPEPPRYRRARHVRATSSDVPQVVRTPPGVQSRVSDKGPSRHSLPQGAREDPSFKPYAQQPLQRPGLAPPNRNNPQRPSSSPASASPTPSDTQSLLRWIPRDLSPEATSKILQKLAEPLSNAEESGYIYIYCVTPANSNPLPEATSFLIPPSSAGSATSPGHTRRTSDVLRTAGIPPNRTHDPMRNRTTRTVTLKIGRAVNVSRRLTQQCADNLTLVRYYPYTPSAPGGPPPQKAANIHRLERLVHLELADRRVKLEEPCETCGRRHQEYFQIEAEKEQLRLVDECVRRWVRFSEENPYS